MPENILYLYLDGTEESLQHAIAFLYLLYTSAEKDIDVRIGAKNHEQMIALEEALVSTGAYRVSRQAD
jgi:hypothetical protein